MNKLIKNRSINKFLVSLLVVISLFAGHSQAKMISTGAVINSNGEHYSQQQLQSALASDELKQQLTDMGVIVARMNNANNNTDESKIMTGFLFIAGIRSRQFLPFTATGAPVTFISGAESFLSVCCSFPFRPATISLIALATLFTWLR